MPSLGSIMGVPLNMEILMFTIIGIVYTAFDTSIFDLHSNIKEIWSVAIPATNLPIDMQNPMRMLLSTIVVIRSCTTHLLLACYVIMLYPVLCSERPSLLLPWLFVGAVKQILMSVLSLATGLVVCASMNHIKETCAYFVAARFIELSPALYMWSLVYSLYREIKTEIDNKAQLEMNPAEALEQHVRRRRARLMAQEGVEKHTPPPCTVTRTYISESRSLDALMSHIPSGVDVTVYPEMSSLTPAQKTQHMLGLTDAEVSRARRAVPHARSAETLLVVGPNASSAQDEGKTRPEKEEKLLTVVDACENNTGRKTRFADCNGVISLSSPSLASKMTTRDSSFSSLIQSPSADTISKFKPCRNPSDAIATQTNIQTSKSVGNSRHEVCGEVQTDSEDFLRGRAPRRGNSGSMFLRLLRRNTRLSVTPLTYQDHHNLRSKTTVLAMECDGTVRFMDTNSCSSVVSFVSAKSNMSLQVFSVIDVKGKTLLEYDVPFTTHLNNILDVNDSSNTVGNRVVLHLTSAVVMRAAQCLNAARLAWSNLLGFNSSLLYKAAVPPTNLLQQRSYMLENDKAGTSPFTRRNSNYSNDSTLSIEEISSVIIDSESDSDMEANSSKNHKKCTARKATRNYIECNRGNAIDRDSIDDSDEDDSSLERAIDKVLIELRNEMCRDTKKRKKKYCKCGKIPIKKKDKEVAKKASIRDVFNQMRKQCKKCYEMFDKYEIAVPEKSSTENSSLEIIDVSEILKKEPHVTDKQGITSKTEISGSVTDVEEMTEISYTIIATKIRRKPSEKETTSTDISKRRDEASIEKVQGSATVAAPSEAIATERSTLRDMRKDNLIEEPKSSYTITAEKNRRVPEQQVAGTDLTKEIAQMDSTKKHSIKRGRLHEDAESPTKDSPWDSSKVVATTEDTTEQTKNMNQQSTKPGASAKYIIEKELIFDSAEKDTLSSQQKRKIDQEHAEPSATIHKTHEIKSPTEPDINKSPKPHTSPKEISQQGPKLATGTDTNVLKPSTRTKEPAEEDLKKVVEEQTKNKDKIAEKEITDTKAPPVIREHARTDLETDITQEIAEASTAIHKTPEIKSPSEQNIRKTTKTHTSTKEIAQPGSEIAAATDSIIRKSSIKIREPTAEDLRNVVKVKTKTKDKIAEKDITDTKAPVVRKQGRTDLDPDEKIIFENLQSVTSIGRTSVESDNVSDIILSIDPENTETTTMSDLKEGFKRFSDALFGKSSVPETTTKEKPEKKESTTDSQRKRLPEILKGMLKPETLKEENGKLDGAIDDPKFEAELDKFMKKYKAPDLEELQSKGSLTRASTRFSLPDLSIPQDDSLAQLSTGVQASLMDRSSNETSDESYDISSLNIVEHVEEDELVLKSNKDEIPSRKMHAKRKSELLKTITPKALSRDVSTNTGSVRVSRKTLNLSTGRNSASPVPPPQQPQNENENEGYSEESLKNQEAKFHVKFPIPDTANKFISTHFKDPFVVHSNIVSGTSRYDKGSSYNLKQPKKTRKRINDLHDSNLDMNSPDTKSKSQTALGNASKKNDAFVGYALVINKFPDVPENAIPTLSKDNIDRETEDALWRSISSKSKSIKACKYECKRLSKYLKRKTELEAVKENLKLYAQRKNSAENNHSIVDIFPSKRNTSSKCRASSHIVLSKSTPLENLAISDEDTLKVKYTKGSLNISDNYLNISNSQKNQYKDDDPLICIFSSNREYLIEETLSLENKAETCDIKPSDDSIFMTSISFSASFPKKNISISKQTLKPESFEESEIQDVYYDIEVIKAPVIPVEKAETGVQASTLSTQFLKSAKKVNNPKFDLVEEVWRAHRRLYMTNNSR